VPDAGAVKSISGLTHIAWLSPAQFLGGWYGVEVVLSAAHVNAGAQAKAGGLGPRRCRLSFCNGPNIEF
jgi:hypothetical protein